MKETIPLSNVQLDQNDILFFAGGHGTMFDFTEPSVAEVIVQAYEQYNAVVRNHIGLSSFLLLLLLLVVVVVLHSFPPPPPPFLVSNGWMLFEEVGRMITKLLQFE